MIKLKIIRSFHPSFVYKVYLQEDSLAQIKEATDVANKITEKLIFKGGKEAATTFLNLALMKKYEESL